MKLCRTDAQAAVIARSLGPSVVKLSLDPNGNHVVQRALQHMPAPRNDFVLEAITGSLVQVCVCLSLVCLSVSVRQDVCMSLSVSVCLLSVSVCLFSLYACVLCVQLRPR